jgi:hypothetical protein
MQMCLQPISLCPKAGAKCEWMKERNFMEITFEKREMAIF